MYEFIPDLRPGELLTAAHVNLLSRAARIIQNQFPGSFLDGNQGSLSGRPPFNQRRVEVVVEDYALGVATGETGIYEIRFRYFNDGSWAIDQEGDPEFLDGAATDDTFVNGDQLTVYWDSQRQMWVKSGGSGSISENVATRVLCEVVEWLEDALHGPGARCYVRWKNGITVPQGVGVPDDADESSNSSSDSTSSASDSSSGTGEATQIVVYDVAGCVFESNTTELVGRWCWADFFMPESQGVACVDDPDSLCRWTAAGICCPTE